MPVKRPITFLVVLAYLLGFAAGFLVLGYLGRIEPIARLQAVAMDQNGEVERAKIWNKAPKEVHNLSAGPSQNVEWPGEVGVGNEVQVKIKTEPGVVCTLRYIQPDMNDRSVPGGVYQIADESGLCSWRWRIAPDTPVGEATIYIATGSRTRSLTFNVVP